MLIQKREWNVILGENASDIKDEEETKRTLEFISLCESYKDDMPRERAMNHCAILMMAVYRLLAIRHKLRPRQWGKKRICKECWAMKCYSPNVPRTAFVQI